VLELEIISDQIRQLNLTPFLMAILVGGAIGLEREVHGRPAGLRTHIMVCLSSTIAIYASRYVPQLVEGNQLVKSLVYDPNRLGAGIVTGIGFLGAAAVIRSGDIVRGITTGACVWAVAVLGVVIGQGHYGLALAGTAIMLTVLVAFDSLFSWVKPVVYRRMLVRGSPAQAAELTRCVRELLLQHRIKVQDLSGEIDQETSQFLLELHLRCRNQLQAPEILEAVCGLEGVLGAEWTRLGL
jgi:putative Mg2+ transporter-C (MgtC) family protein